MEQFSNAGAATLNGAITSGAATLVVSNTVACPTSGTFRIRIDNEVLKVTGVSGSTWTVSRGNGGTTAASHADGVIIYVIVTKEALDAILSLQQSGTEISTRRVLNFTGATVTDDATNSRTNIAIAGQTYEATWTKPVAANYSWINQGSSTATVNGEGSIFISTPAVSGNAARGYMIAVPSTPYTIIARVVPMILDQDYNSCGMAWASNTANQFHIITFYKNNLQVNYETFTAYSGTDISVNTGQASQFTWIKLTDDGTNRTFSVGVDGENWLQIWTGGRTTHFTPTHVGAFLESNNATWPASMILASWSQS